jgi:hypothetical protein
MNLQWVIERMECIPQTGDLTNVVVECDWRCNASEDQASATAYGSVSFAVPADDSEFIPYASLTQDEVLGWVWGSGVDKQAIEAGLTGQIDAQLNPTVVTLPLPWQSAQG